MLAVAYLVLFLAISAALTWWRVASFERRYRPVPTRAPQPPIRHLG
jgi:hypothetical protein